MNWEKFLSAEDLYHDCDQEVLIWDGCEYHIDYVETDSEFGAFYMANDTQPEFYCRLTEPESLEGE